MNTYRIYAPERIQISQNRSYTVMFIDMPDGYGLPPTRMTICSAKCTRAFHRITKDTRDGLCDPCHRAQFEGEPEMIL